MTITYQNVRDNLRKIAKIDPMKYDDLYLNRQLLSSATVVQATIAAVSVLNL